MALNELKIIHQIAPSVWGVDWGLDGRRIEVWFPSPPHKVQIWIQLRCPVECVLGRRWPRCAADQLTKSYAEDIKIHLHSSIHFHSLFYCKACGKFELTLLEYMCNGGSCVVNSCAYNTPCDRCCLYLGEILRYVNRIWGIMRIN